MRARRPRFSSASRFALFARTTLEKKSLLISSLRVDSFTAQFLVPFAKTELTYSAQTLVGVGVEIVEPEHLGEGVGLLPRTLANVAEGGQVARADAPPVLPRRVRAEQTALTHFHQYYNLYLNK